MTDEERVQLGEKRRLIYSNVANGVPLENIKAAFLVSELEIQQTVAFVGKKITEYRFRRCTEAHDPRVACFASPPIACDTIDDARKNRRAALETLAKLGPKYLSSQLLLPSITVQTAQRQDIKEINHRMRGSR